MRPARECVSIPVVGPAETAMHIAAMLGHSFSVITVLDNIRPMLENQAAVYGLPGKLASVRSVRHSGLELEFDLDRVKRALTEQAVIAVERDGAARSSSAARGCSAAPRAVARRSLVTRPRCPGNRSGAGGRALCGGADHLGPQPEQTHLSHPTGEADRRRRVTSRLPCGRLRSSRSMRQGTAGRAARLGRQVSVARKQPEFFVRTPRAASDPTHSGRLLA